jgi:hypothetical protein
VVRCDGVSTGGNYMVKIDVIVPLDVYGHEREGVGFLEKCCL